MAKQFLIEVVIDAEENVSVALKDASKSMQNLGKTATGIRPAFKKLAKSVQDSGKAMAASFREISEPALKLPSEMRKVFSGFKLMASGCADTVRSLGTALGVVGKAAAKKIPIVRKLADALSHVADNVRNKLIPGLVNQAKQLALNARSFIANLPPVRAISAAVATLGRVVTGTVIPALSRVGKTFVQIGNTIMRVLAPAIQGVSKIFVGVGRVLSGISGIVGSVGGVFIRLGSAVGKVAFGAMQRFSTLVSKVAAGALKKLASAGTVALKALSVGALGAVGAVSGLAAGLAALTLKAAPLKGIGLAFDKMSRRVGLSLDELREAAAGTVSDFELMRKANIALTGAGNMLGKEFGKALPALLETARAAAKATGQDVDFLFESLVTGIKRGSPMLIDNTGLVLKLGEANEAMAATLGKTVEGLTAEEKSVALLRATVAAGGKMVSEFGSDQLTAAEQVAQFKAQIKNTVDRIGIGFLPVLRELLGPINQIASEAGPKLIAWAEKAGEVLGTALPFAVEAITNLLGGNFERGMSNARAAIATVFGPDVAMAFDNFVRNMAGLAEKVGGFIEAMRPGFERLAAWLGENIPAAIEKLSAFWIGTLQPAIETAGGFIQEHVLPLLAQLGAWLGENVPAAIEKLSGFWLNTLQPAIETVWGFFKEHIVPLLREVGHVLEAVVGKALEAAAGLWQNVLQPALEGVWQFIQEHVIPIFEELAGKLGPTEAAFDKIKTAIGKVTEFLGNLADKITALELPEWLTPGSATPFEGALAGVAAVVGESLSPLLAELAGPVFAALCEALVAAAELTVELIETFLEAEDRAERLRDSLRDLTHELASKMAPAIKAMYPLFNELARRVNLVDIAVESLIHEVYALIAALSEVHIPSGLRPGSPSPFERSLEGVADAMEEVGALSGGLTLPLEGLTAGIGAGAATYNQQSYGGDTFYVTVNDQGAAAMLMAMIEERRRRRLNTFTGYGGL